MTNQIHFPTFRTPQRPTGNRRLICGEIDCNDIEVVQRLIRESARVLAESAAWHRLEVYNYCYFRTSNGPVPREPGWYVIAAEKSPLYVGRADNLDDRLNSMSGSLDNFAKHERLSDPARNFIKKFSMIGYIRDLSCGVIRESDLLAKCGFSGPLESIDRNNVEKILGLFRNKVVGVF